MNKTFVWITGTLILVVGLGLYVVNQQSQKAKIAEEETTMMKGEGSVMKKDWKTMEKDSKMITADSRYIEYSKAAFDNAASNRRVLFFYANWCPICKPADADLKANIDKIPSDVTVIRVNYNDTDTDQEEKDLAKQYGITYQHTFVQIDAQGKEVTKWNGGETRELLANIR
jgi:thiol-disulfide isomerase/thioredoxin